MSTVDETEKIRKVFEKSRKVIYTEKTKRRKMKMRSRLEEHNKATLATNKLINRKAIDFSLMEKKTLRKNN